MLPAEYKPKKLYDLLRLGKSNDGGYLVEKASLGKAEVLVSMGVSDDWSFEKDFRRSTKVPITAYDHTISKAFFRNNVVRTVLKPMFKGKLKEIRRELKVYQDYCAFFVGEIKHKQTKVGMRSQDGAYIDQIFKEEIKDKSVFFKIDIEGSEYRVLPDLLMYEERICGMVIEFHDIDLHIERIINFLLKTKLELVHIHANNSAACDSDGNPLVVEMSFAKDPVSVGEEWKNTHPLDEKNAIKLPDIKLSFKDI